MEWTKREIQNFGGDSLKITIIGNSAGGLIVEYLSASPAISYDLFDKAIISSPTNHYKKNTNLNSTLIVLNKFKVNFELKNIF